MAISPTISSSFDKLQLQEQRGKQVVTHTKRTNARIVQQMCVQEPHPRTLTRTDTLESDSSLSRDFVEMYTKGLRHDSGSQLRMQETLAITTEEHTTVARQHSGRGHREDSEGGAVVCKPGKHQPTGCDDKKGAAVGYSWCSPVAMKLWMYRLYPCVNTL